MVEVRTGTVTVAAMAAIVQVARGDTTLLTRTPTNMRRPRAAGVLVRARRTPRTLRPIMVRVTVETIHDRVDISM